MQQTTQSLDLSKDTVLLSGTVGPFALAFHRMMFPTLVVDADCKVLCISDEAHAALMGLDVLRIEKGILFAGDRAVDRELQFALSLARQNKLLSDFAAAIPVLRPQRLPIILYILPALCSLTFKTENLQPVAVIYFHDPMAPRKVGALAKHFHFTDTETALVEALLAYPSVGTACRRARISQEMAPLLIKRIYGKTGAKNLADITRLFALGEAPMRFDR